MRRFLTISILGLATAIGTACASEEEKRRTAAEGPTSTLLETDDPTAKVLCIRAQDAPFDSDVRRSLEACLGLSSQSVRAPGGKNGLVVYHGGPEFAAAVADLYQRDAPQHPVQLMTVLTGREGVVAVGSEPESGSFPCWGPWEGEERAGAEVSVHNVLRSIRVRPDYDSDGSIHLCLTPTLTSPESEAGARVLSHLAMRLTLPQGGAAVVGPVGDSPTDGFGEWFFTRRTEDGLKPIFMVFLVHCLN